MKKIAILTHEFPPMHGGVGVSSYRLSQVLKKEYDVSVIHFVQQNEVILLGKNNRRVESDVKVIEVPFSNYSNSQKDDVTKHESSFKGTREQQECFISLDKIQQEEKFDLFITLFITNFSHLSTLVAKKHGIPQLVSIRGNDIGKHFFMPSTFSYLEYILKNADYITSVNQELIDTADTITPIKEKSMRIHNSIDFENMKYDENFVIKGLDKNKLTIASVGIFRFKKGLLYILDALKDAEFDYQLLLVGDYKSKGEKEIHENYIREFDMQDKIILTGMVDQKDRFSYTNLADIILVPSLFSEGCPSTLLEAMALKKPIICSDAGACPEIIDHEKNGLVIPQADSLALKDAINKLVSDDSLRDKYASAAYEKVQSFNFEKELKEWTEAINKCF